MSNMKIWDQAYKTDPRQVKEITGKQYRGNSPKPFYIVRRLTEMFGPCGIGWGIEIASERMERLTETDVLHIANVVLWYKDGDVTGSIQQIGQTKATYLTSKGTVMVDEDAPKKSVTDALVKCASYLGFAGDIFDGRWDDSKYVAELKREFEKPAKTAGGVIKATDGALESLPADERDYIKEIAADITSMTHPDAMVEAIEAAQLENEQKVALWSLLPSNIRSAIKKEQERKQAA